MWALLLLLALASAASGRNDTTSSCYDHLNRPKRCLPEFENAAFHLSGEDLEATNTCGEDGIPSSFCVQTGARQYESCQRCIYGMHPPDYMTDINIMDNLTWWQSSTMHEGINEVNITLHLRKAYDITYIRIVFYSPRPESFAIYKRTRENGPWEPYQYYSSDCRGVYQLEERETADVNNQTTALCTSEFSEILPLTGGNVVFSTPKGRPTDSRFIRSAAFQEWVTATDIRIVLTRMNTFGDEIFGEPTVLKSYFYAISDIAIGARCKCNGHASECIFVQRDGELKKVCNCTHNTKGDDCETCDDFHQDVPWTPWTWASVYEIEASECKPCNCNGYSKRCVFDKNLYEKTGHGGHCIDCSHNRDGPNCERCKDNYYQNISTLACVPCNCDETGSRSLQCNSEGKCDCKPGVTGDKCDHCAPDYYEFGSTGCKACNCLVAGSFDNEPRCDQELGNCVCKANVEGKECRRCKPGFFSLDKDNEFGCTPCFCYGHTSVCSLASGYSRVFIENTFARNAERWTAQTKFQKPVSVQYDSLTQVITVTADKEPVYFLAPERFLGDQRAAYNQDLEFKLRVNDEIGVGSVNDVILEGNGLQIYQTISGQGNNHPSTQNQVFKFRLHEDPDFGWEPRRKSIEFMSILSNLTAIKIRGTYSRNGIGFLDDVKLGTARRGAAGQPAGWIEMCSCPKGYVGQYCESCAAGYRHDPPNGGPFSVCVPCNCNNHADHCDPESGRCLCLNNTAGDMCERCDRGYYGNALEGTPHDCKVCPCPEQGACYQLGETVICLECPKGYAGARCDQCSDGYYGDVDGSSGSVKLCKPCDCNMNVDQNAVGICDSNTGECLKCIYNTDGPHCDQCLPGFYGDALALPKEWDICKPCMCDPIGTEQSGSGPLLCNQITGQCQCKPNVTGIKCNQCQPGYYNIESGRGCQPCDCNPVGSYNSTCDVHTGQCHCKPGVTGRLCDLCQDHHYGFGLKGCLPCECDEIGSKHLQCDQNGQCVCSENVEGRRCDRCKENKYDRQRNCVDCPVCYSLVQESVNQHRANLGNLENLLKNIKENPNIVSNEESFERDLKEVQKKVDQLWNDAKTYSGDDSKLNERIDETKNKLDTLEDALDKVDNEIEETDSLVEVAERNTTAIREQIENALEDIQSTMDYILTDGVEALAKARNRSIEFGTQNQQMSDIASQARTTVQKQLEEAEQTKAVAEMALNISNQGYLLSKEAREKQLNSSSALESLSSELENTRLRMDEMEKIVQTTLNEVSDAHSDALSFAIEVNNLVIPEVDFARIKSEAQKEEEEGKKLEKEAERLKEEFAKVAGDVESNVNESYAKLEEGKRLQQEADTLLAEADAARAKAAAAVELGDKILRDANETLASLQDFDQQVKESKAKALTALETIPDIEILLQEARDKTTNAEEALSGAESNAEYASTTAQSAQKQYAQQASSEANAIRQKAEDTKRVASLLRDELSNLEDKLLINQDKLSKIVDKASENNMFIEKAKEKVSQAQSKSQEAADQITNAMESLQSITRELNDLADIDEDSLKQLELKLNQAENDFNEANLDEQIRVLTNARLQQQQRLRSYEDELSRLVEEVARIKAIKESLPSGCYKRPGLEV